jgi:hypothetical protein
MDTGFRPDRAIESGGHWRQGYSPDVDKVCKAFGFLAVSSALLCKLQAFL